MAGQKETFSSSSLLSRQREFPLTPGSAAHLQGQEADPAAAEAGPRRPERKRSLRRARRCSGAARSCLARSRSRLAGFRRGSRASRAYSILPSSSLPPPPAPGPPTLGVRMCSMAGPRLQGPGGRSLTHLRARAARRGGRVGRGLRSRGARRAAGLAPPPGAPRAPGRRGRGAPAQPGTRPGAAPHLPAPPGAGWGRPAKVACSLSRKAP